MNNQIRRQLLERHRASGFPGSIMDVFSAYNQGIDLIADFQQQQQQQVRQQQLQQLQQAQQAQQQEQQVVVAETPEEQAEGLRPYHATGNTNQTMVFPNVPANTPFNTVGMKAPINIEKYNNQGHLIESFKNVPPGIQSLPTGSQEGIVIETPANMKTGGRRKYQPGGEITTLQPRRTPTPTLDLGIRPETMSRSAAPQSRYIDPIVKEQNEADSFAISGMKREAQWADPNQRAAMTSGRATPVSVAETVTPGGDLTALIQSGVDLAQGNYVQGAVGAGLALGSIFLPGTIRIPGRGVAADVVTRNVDELIPSNIPNIPSFGNRIKSLEEGIGIVQNAARDADTWNANWFSHPETRRRIDALIPENIMMENSSQSARSFINQQPPPLEILSSEDFLKLDELSIDPTTFNGVSFRHFPSQRVDPTLTHMAGKELITPSTSSSWRSGLLPATQRTIDKLVYHSPEQQVRRGQEWMRNWVNNPETQRRIGTLVPEESQMVGDPRTIRNYMQEYDYNVTLLDDETRGLFLEENARWGRNNPGYSSVHHPVHRVEGSVSFPNQTVLDPDPIRNLETSTVHELTHSVAPSEFINAATNSTILGKTKTSPGFEGTDIFRRWLTPEAKNAEDLYRRGIDTRTNYGALGYMSNPTEQHARIMQLRHMGDLKPGQQVNAATIKDLREQNRYTRAVEDKFFDIYQYPDRMANVFNTLPSIIPATVGVGLLNQSSDKSTNNNRGSLKFGGIREYQGGGSKNVDPFSSFKIAKHMAKKEMIKRADGSYSQRGLWDNIRANKGSGKKPTAAMLKQEKKIKAKTRKK